MYQTCLDLCASKPACLSFDILLNPNYAFWCTTFNVKIGSYNNGDPIYPVDWQNIGTTKLAGYK
jgi:hypothetical protein